MQSQSKEGKKSNKTRRLSLTRSIALGQPDLTQSCISSSPWHGSGLCREALEKDVILYTKLGEYGARCYRYVTLFSDDYYGSCAGDRRMEKRRPSAGVFGCHLEGWNLEICRGSNIGSAKTAELQNGRGAFLGEAVPGWTIEKCTTDDKKGVYDLLTRAFFKYEPLTCDMQEEPPMDDLFAIKLLGQGHSYKAVLPSGRIVGVVVNARFEDIPDEDPPTAGRISQVVEFFDYIEKLMKFDEKGFLEMFILAVDPDCRRQGMAKELGRVSVQYAKMTGHRGIKISCTSKYSADVAAALGFTLVYSLPYADYKDAAGKPIFTPALPHTHAKIYVKEFPTNGKKSN